MPNHPEVGELKRMYVFVTGWLLATVIIYFFGQGNHVFLLYASNIISPSSAFLPALYGLMLVRRYASNLKDRFARIWVYLTAGLFVWLLGEITWTVYALALSVTVPYPSIADLFWIAGYFPLAFALYRYLVPFKEALPLKKILTATGIGLLADLGVFAILIGPILTIETEPVAQVFDLAYPFLDMMLLGMSIAGMLMFFPGRISRFWVWLNLGFILIVIADLLFSYSTALGFYYEGHPIDLLYYFGDLFILLSLYEHTRILEGDWGRKL